MKKIIVASTNPVKINATKQAFAKAFPKEVFSVKGYSVPSGVSDQPKSDEETLRGARNRAQGAKKQHPRTDYWVGIEGGVETFEGKLITFAWCVVLGKKQFGESRSASLLLPDHAQELINQGLELGEVDDIMYHRKNSKQKWGTIGLLTNNLVTRTDYYRETIALALVPFLKPKLYPSSKL